MAAKQIAYDNDAREKILRGIQKLARAVKVTLGPSGRTSTNSETPLRRRMAVIVNTTTDLPRPTPHTY